MEHTRIVGPSATWSRDFALIGAVTGSLAPFLVIFDTVFALSGGFVGAATGAVVGAGLARAVVGLRTRIPLSIFIGLAVGVGAVWGGTTGAVAGAVASGAGSQMGGGATVLGLMFGSVAGAMQLGWIFLPYLIAASHRRTAPVVALGLLVGPLLGWGSLLGMFWLVVGGWVVLLPTAIVWAAMLEYSVHQARCIEDKAAAGPTPALTSTAASSARESSAPPEGRGVPERCVRGRPTGRPAI